MRIRKSKPEKPAVLPVVLVLAVAGACAGSALAAGPHEHGVARLLLAYERDTLELQLTAPAESLVGFEHAPDSAEEASAVAAADALLHDPLQVFRLEDAECDVQETRVDNPFADAGDEHVATDGTGHEDHDHHAGEETSTHTDFVADYRLVCPGSTPPSGIEILLFEHFPRLERVTLEWLLPNSAGTRDLRRDTPRRALD